MPVSPTYPGVYIEELPSGVRTIVGVSTSVAAFVGSFRRGPLNRPLQLFSMGDFQRELGGLFADSATTYGIRQFFLNGGTECWAVRVTPSGTFATATAVLQNEGGAAVLTATAGRQMRGVAENDPGVWGNNLRITVDYPVNPNDTNVGSKFDLSVAEVAIRDGRESVVREETFRNLVMANGDPRYALSVVNETSRMIQLIDNVNSATTTTRPAATGTWGIAMTAPPALTAGDTLDLTYGTTTGTATLQFTTAPANWNAARGVLEAAIRAIDPDDPVFARATVRLEGTRLRVLAGRQGTPTQPYDADTVLTISDGAGGAGTALGLVGTGAFANVQEYALGRAAGAGMRGAGTPGVDGGPPGSVQLRGVESAKTGLYALEDVDLFNILCIPEAADLVLTGTTDETPMREVFAEAVQYCERRRAFLIVDPPGRVDRLDEARDWLDASAGLRHRNAAAYFPQPRIPDPLRESQLRPYPPSGAIAGLYARTDATRGVWKAPAGTEGVIRNAPELAYKLNDMENGQLNPLGLNCLRNFRVVGNVCWGARTLDGADVLASDWKYIPVRRLALFIEESLYRGTQWVVFEPNDEPLWAQIRLNVGAFMHRLFRQGAFQGTSSRDAYRVKCDAETTTQDDRNRGVVNILVAFAPLKPAEFVIIQIQQLAGQIPT